MEMKHTPGSWNVFDEIDMQDSEPMLSIQANDSSESDTELSVCGIYNVTEKCRANARLIAAAPTLLMALEFLLDKAESFNVAGTYFDQFRENRDALDTARDAIAKATGSAL